MKKEEMKKICLGIITLAVFLFPCPSLLLAQGDTKNQTKPMLTPPKERPTEETKGPVYTRTPKKAVIAGVPLGASRGEITALFNAKKIAPTQRSAPMDIFPRLIGEISFIKKAYLYYNQDRLTKLTIFFNAPPDNPNNAGEPLFELYREIRKKLVNDYGQPTNTTDYLHPNFYYQLVAIETGNASKFDYWENVDDLKILLTLKGKDGEIECALTYQYLYFQSDLEIKVIRGN
jgi:hypothetical protein